MTILIRALPVMCLLICILFFEQELGWKNRYRTSQEIYQYLRHCADKYEIRPHVQFNTEIASAKFDALQGVWHIQKHDWRTV